MSFNSPSQHLARAARDGLSLENKRVCLIEAWRERRVPRIAEIIVVASERLARLHPRPPKASTLAESQAQWIEQCAKHDTRDLEWLMREIPTLRSELSTVRVKVIAEWPDDPRVGLGFLELLGAYVFTSLPCRPFWTAVFRELTQRADRSMLPAIARLRSQVQGSRMRAPSNAPAPISEFDLYMLGKLRALEDHIVARCPIVEPFDEENAILDAIRRSIEEEKESPEKTLEDFLKEIWARPDDDGPREVLADWLLERHDPRGELITLQLARARRPVATTILARERELLAKHARAWMDVLEPAVDTKLFRFERGFLYSCKIRGRALMGTPGLVKHPAWATVREYEVEPAMEAACDAWIDHMIALGAKRH